jgi:hypothetical protein
LGIGSTAPKAEIDLDTEPALSELGIEPDDAQRCVDEVRDTCEADKSLLE